MNPLDCYIEEGILNRNIKKDVDDLKAEHYKEKYFNLFKDAGTALSTSGSDRGLIRPADKQNQLWDMFFEQNCKIDKNGNIEINLDPDDTRIDEDVLKFVDSKKTYLPLNISKFSGGTLRISYCNNLLTLKDIFAPGCQFDGTLRITDCTSLMSLEGLENVEFGKYSVIRISYNPRLDSLKGLPKGFVHEIWWYANELEFDYEIDFRNALKKECGFRALHYSVV